jgi:hypothetical protein
MKYRRKFYYEEFEDIKGAKRQTMIHKTYTQNQRSSNTSPTTNKSYTQMFRKGKQFLLN